MPSYTDKQLNEHYDNFIAFTKKAFASNPERLEKLLFMYSETEMGGELTVSPASGKTNYHSAYEGGYLDHVMNVCKNAVKMMTLFESGGGTVDFTLEELLFAAMHHDLGKLGDGTNPYYVPQTSEWHRKNHGEVYTRNPEIAYMDVAHRALWLLNQYGIKYTQKEMFGIMLADGLYAESSKPYLISFTQDYHLKTELPYILHWADHMSTRQEYTQYLASK